MALIACRECGKDVSTEATTCPHCGVPNPISPIPSRPALASPPAAPFSRPSSPPPSTPHRVAPAPSQGVTSPRFTATYGLIAVFALALIGLIWYGVAIRSGKPASPATPVPVAAARKDEPGPLPWQACPTEESPGYKARRHAVPGAPIEIEWYWCQDLRSRSAVVRVEVKSNVDRILRNLLLDFTIYNGEGAQVGNRAVWVRNLDAHAKAEAEEDLFSHEEWMNDRSVKLLSVRGF